MEHLAFHDALTGLPNRVMFEQHLTLALARARRDGSAVAVVFADLDDFKPVNDTHGHATGDEMLRQVGARLRLAVRETDLVARHGGDEFLVLIADLPPGVEMVDANSTVSSIVDRIHDVVAQPFPMRVGELALTVSLGCAIFPRDAETTEGLLRVADEEMYRRKAESTDRPSPLRRLA
jgi:diguanylate cyclase (GGDEF)-like protein